MTGLRAVWLWVGRHPWLITFVLIVGGNVGAWRAVEAEADARRLDACESSATTRDTIREIARDVGIASGQESGEALIDAVGADADPQVVERYRARLEARLTARLTEIVAELPDRRWNGDECIDVPVED